MICNFLTNVAPDTHLLCVSALGDEISLITLKLQVTKDLSLRALDDCVASSKFVRRQSLEGKRLKTVDPDITPTRLMVRLATGAYATVEKTCSRNRFMLEDK